MNDSSIIYKFEPFWGNWTVSKYLGQGNLGIVYTLKNNQITEELSVIKLLSLPSDEQNNVIFEYYKNDKLKINEFYENSINNIFLTLKNLSKLKGHSNIISIENFMVDKDEAHNKWYIFLKMEYATPLNEYLKKNIFTEKDLVRLALGICNALNSLHSLNITHENIKESNIFISKNDTFKISDFNLIKDFQSAPLLDPIIIPPEIAEGKQFTCVSDIYCLGILLYKLGNNGNLPFITNTNIYSAADIKAAIAKRLSGSTLPAPVNASEALAKIILKACAYDVDSRYKKIDLLKSDLKKIIQQNETNPKIKIETESLNSTFSAKNNRQPKIEKDDSIFGNSQNTINYLPPSSNSIDKKVNFKKIGFLFILTCLILFVGILFFKNFYKNDPPKQKKYITTPTNSVRRKKVVPTPKINVSNKNNLIKNYDIEETNLIWQKRSLRAKGQQFVSSKECYNGSKSLAIKLNSILYKGQYCEMTYYQDLEIAKGAKYKLTLSAKTENLSSNKNLNGVWGSFATVLYKNYAGSIKYKSTPYINTHNKWKQYELTFKVPNNSISNKISIHLGICNETGTVYFDYLKLEKLHTLPGY